jgi:hypothetical protein
MIHWHARLLLTLVFLAVNLAVVHHEAMAQVDAIHFSTDIHTRLPADGGSDVILSDDAIAEVGIASGTATVIEWLDRLDRSDVDAFHRGDAACGDAPWFSLSTTTEIAGTVMAPADVFTNAGIKVFDARAAGVPDGVDIDAISRDPASCDLVFSVDVTTELGGVVVGPADLIRWRAADGFSLIAATELPGNLDALHLLGVGRFLFSLDRDADLNGLLLRDDDIAEVIPTGSDEDYAIALAPRALDASFQSANVDALWALLAPPVGDFRWTATEQSVLENGELVVVQIERLGGSAGPVSLTVETVNDTATAGVDYTAFSDPVEFGDGEVNRALSILILDNDALDGPRQFFVDLVDASAGGLIAPTRITVRIRDDENDTLFDDRFEN